MNKCQACKEPNLEVWTDTCEKCRDIGCDYVEWECFMCYAYMTEKEHYLLHGWCPKCIKLNEPDGLNSLGF